MQYVFSIGIASALSKHVCITFKHRWLSSALRKRIGVMFITGRTLCNLQTNKDLNEVNQVCTSQLYTYRQKKSRLLVLQYSSGAQTTADTALLRSCVRIYSHSNEYR